MARAESIGYLTACLHRYAGRYLDKELERYGLGNGTYSFLVTLYRGDGLNQNRLSELLHTDKANTARAVKKLIEAGYIRRERDKGDNRAYSLFVTPKALKIKPDVIQILRSWTTVVTQGMNDKTINSARSYLKRMIENAAYHFNETTETKP